MRSYLQWLSKLKFLSASRRFELYPPYLLMRVKIVSLADDWSMARIRLPLNWLSANAAGNMFGGYQADMAPPVNNIRRVSLMFSINMIQPMRTYDTFRRGETVL